MKLLSICLIALIFVIAGVQNAPAIHPVHVQTIPLHPITVKPTSARIPTHETPGTPVHPSKHSSWYSSTSDQSTDWTSSSSTLSTTTSHHSSWWNSGNLSAPLIVRIFLYVFSIFLVSKLIGILCKSKKPNEKNSSALVKNMMSVSTINGQREEPPPAYGQIQKV